MAIRRKQQSPQMDELKKSRFIFLHRLYEMSGGDRDLALSLFNVGHRARMNHNQSNLVGRYLFDEGLISLPGSREVSHTRIENDPTTGKVIFKEDPETLPAEWGDTDQIYITHKGIIEVEQALSEPGRPTNHFPANIANYTINVGRDMIGSAVQQGSSGAKQMIKVPRDHENKERKVRVLFVSANPKTTNELELIKECNNIRDRLALGEYGDQFDFDQRHQVSVSEMDRYLLDYKPQVLHFSGHGSSDGIIIFEDSDHDLESTSIKALSDLFRIVNADETMTKDKKIKLVFLSACYSEKQAKGISKYVDCVVGMSTSVTDEAARIFAESFYQAIGFGKSIQTAFDLGCNKVARLDIPEEHIPRLKNMIGIDPAESYLVKGKD